MTHTVTNHARQHILSHALTHSLTHTRTHSHSHSHSHLHSYSLTHSLTLTNILTRHTEGARTTEGVEHCLALCRIGLEDLGRDLGQLHPGELVTLSDVHTHARTHYTATALHTHI